MKKAVFAQGAPAAIGPYSHGVAIGDLFFTSGQIALVPETGKLVDGGIQEQTEQVLRNLEMVLSANGIYATRFPNDPPARSCVQVAALPAGSRLEIELIAAKA